MKPIFVINFTYESARYTQSEADALEYVSRIGYGKCTCSNPNCFKHPTLGCAVIKEVQPLKGQAP